MIILVFVLGLNFGSFVNALVWRMHMQAEKTQNSPVRQAQGKQLKTQNFSIASGRSMCTDCGHTLAWHDLLPVVSWLSLGGRCRYCHQPISWQYPAVELLTAALFVLSYVFFPALLTPHSALLLAIWLALLTGFMALAVYDLRWMILPNRIVFPMQALAVLYVLTAFVISSGDWHVVFGAVMGVVFSAGLFYALFQVSNGKWIGGGDVKLAVVLGLVLGGAVESFLMIFIASAMGSLIGIPLLLAKKTKLQGKLPFGPLLMVATVIVYLFGTAIIAWYKQQFLFV